ncbi:TlpA family protein disulfide reductase [Kribbella deserti]|uniref:TlpA family protein disulfide reductase n=1 Tax=Kribbella deserti TaxID=1926257 RepID=A0ABV6QHU6_9ACTN
MKLVAVALALALVAGCGTARPGDQTGQPPQTANQTETAQGQPRPSNANLLKACPSTESRPPTANDLPDVSLPCLGEGPDIRLADLRGPLLINVWAQWCGPCRDEAPYLAELAKSGKIQLLGVDYADPRPDQAVKFAVEHGLAYPHLSDPDKQLAKPLRIPGPPMTVFVTAKGEIAYSHIGPFRSQEQLDQLVREKLGVTR